MTSLHAWLVNAEIAACGSTKRVSRAELPTDSSVWHHFRLTSDAKLGMGLEWSSVAVGALGAFAAYSLLKAITSVRANSVATSEDPNLNLKVRMWLNMADQQRRMPQADQLHASSSVHQDHYRSPAHGRHH